MLVMKGNESGYQDLPSYTMRSRNTSRFFFFFVVLFLLVVGMLAGLFFLGYSKRDANMVTPTPVITEAAGLLPTSSASAIATLSVNPSLSTGGLSSVYDQTKLDRKALTVVVLNGSGEPGAASGVSTYLKDLGYQIARVGNADGFTYRNLTVTVKRSKSGYGRLLKRDLQANPSFASVSASVNDSISAEAEVIVGSK